MTVTFECQHSKRSHTIEVARILADVASFVQPNGNVIVARLMGDEWWVDGVGYTAFEVLS